MDFFECVAARRSVRAYESRPVEEEKLDKVIEAALAAPSAHNYQPLKILVISTKGREAALKSVYGRPWLVEAPLVLLVCVLRGKSWVRSDGKDYSDVDAAIAMEHIVLAATALGLGTCWVGAFDPKAARSVLALPPDWEPIAFTPLGYGRESPPARPRKAREEIVIRLGEIG